MKIVCPTITAVDIEEFNDQLNKIKEFSKRIHIDLMDGVLAPSHSVSIGDVKWPSNLVVDIHLMFDSPSEIIAELINLKPYLVIIHAEATADHQQLAEELHRHGIKAGLAIQATTSVDSVREIINYFDQVLIFAGHLGFQGGNSDLSQMVKAHQLEDLGYLGEIAWDGGINLANISQLANNGIGVFNVGGFIQTSDNPKDAYTKLLEVINR